jgi:hypothetical protein
VTADLLKRLDMKVDFAAVDWGTVVARRAQWGSSDSGSVATASSNSCRLTGT